MKRSVHFTSAARTDLERATEWYATHAAALVPSLLSAVDRAISRIAAYPEAAQPVGTRTRRVPVRGFPLGIFYVINASEIVVVALEHHRREPHDWT